MSVMFKRFHSINYMYNNDTMKPFFRKVDVFWLRVFHSLNPKLFKRRISRYLVITYNLFYQVYNMVFVKPHADLQIKKIVYPPILLYENIHSYSQFFR